MLKSRAKTNLHPLKRNQPVFRLQEPETELVGVIYLTIK